MPINAGHEYFAAEARYLQAKTSEEKISATEEMIKTAPKHKGSENLLALLKTRLKKLKEAQEKSRKSGKSSHKTIRKEGFQIILLGLPSSGKSSLLSKLTNAKPEVAPYGYTTREPVVGTFEHQGVKAQMIDLPSIGSDNFDLGLLHTADLILIVVASLAELEKSVQLCARSGGKQVIVVTKSDLRSESELRKLQETIKSKKLDAFVVSSVSGYRMQELKEGILLHMDVIRVYFKEPGKSPSPIPMVVHTNATLYEIAERIYKGFSKKIREARVTGPSSKFPNQKVGLSHICKDKDILEFHTIV